MALVIDSIDAWETGTEQHLRRLIHALDRSVFDPRLYFLRPPVGPITTPCAMYLAGNRPEVRWYRAPWTLVRLVGMFRRHRPQIVQTFFRDSTYYGVTAARIAGVPARIISVRNTGYWMKAPDRLIAKWIARFATGWQCNSRAASQWLLETQGVPPEKVKVLHNAVDLDRLSPATAEQRALARHQLGLPPDAPVIVSVASLRSVKDLPTLIDAASVVVQALPDAQFLVLGEGPDRAMLEARRAALGLSERIRFAGTQKDIRPYLAASDLALLTSRSEASSNSVLEYMAAGVPAILSDIPANRELAEEVFFEPGNAADLARKIVGLWRDPTLRNRMRVTYRERAVQHDLGTFRTLAQDYYLGLAEACS